MSNLAAFKADLIELLPSLRAFARSLAHNPALADDLVQDTLLRALKSWPSPAPDNPKAWLFTVMHNHYANWARSKGRERRAFAAVAVEPNRSASGGQIESLELSELSTGLAQLPEDQRQVLLLISLEGLAYAETAEVLQVPIGTVMSRLARARERLRRHLEGAGTTVLRRVK